MIQGVASYENVSDLVGSLIASNMCSYRDLKFDLTLEDAYKLREILVIKNYHDWLATRPLEDR